MLKKSATRNTFIFREICFKTTNTKNPFLEFVSIFSMNILELFLDDTFMKLITFSYEHY